MSLRLKAATPVGQVEDDRLSRVQGDYKSTLLFVPALKYRRGVDSYTNG